MEIKHNHKHTKRAQNLRKNATPQERHLWYDFLNRYPVRFRRQVAIDRYILDFYCAEARLIVEIDGSQHYMDVGKVYDEERTEALSKLGLDVIRFSNRDVNMEFSGVCQEIHNVVCSRIGYDPYDRQ